MSLDESSQVNYLYNQNQIGLHDLWKIKHFLVLDPSNEEKLEPLMGKNEENLIFYFSVTPATFTSVKVCE